MVMVVVAICAFLMRHLGGGPRWPEILTTFEANCRVSWWTYLLYVQNFVLTDQQVRFERHLNEGYYESSYIY